MAKITLTLDREVARAVLCALDEMAEIESDRLHDIRSARLRTASRAVKNQLLALRESMVTS